MAKGESAAGVVVRWLIHNVRVALAAPSDHDGAAHCHPDGLRALIRESRIALVTTRDAGGALHTQPMEVSDRDFDGELWFATPPSAPVVDHIRARAGVQVTYVDNRSNRCVVLDGIARLCSRAELTNSSWRAPFTTWFAPATGHAAEAFIRVDVVSADVWE